MMWFAVMTKPAKEALADLNLRWLGYETCFLFTKKRARSKKSKLLPHLSRVAYFPRYVFVNTVLARLAGVKDAIGVSGVVTGPGGDPFPIPHSAMLKIIPLSDGTGWVHRHAHVKPSFEGEPGDRVRIGEGSSFWNFCGVIRRVLGDTLLVVELEHAFAGTSEVKLPINQVSEVIKRVRPLSHG